MPLIGAIQGLASTVAQVRPQQEISIQDADLDQAVATLTKLYTATSSDRVKFAVERACASTGKPEQYENLHSPCGPVLSATDQPKIYDAGNEKGKQLSMNFQIASFGHVDFSRLTCLIVFKDERTGKEVTEPAGIRGLENISMGSMGGGQQFDLPQGIGPGQYRVFLEFVNADGAVVSRGWGSTLSL